MQLMKGKTVLLITVFDAVNKKTIHYKVVTSNAINQYLQKLNNNGRCLNKCRNYKIYHNVLLNFTFAIVVNRIKLSLQTSMISLYKMTDSQEDK